MAVKHSRRKPSRRGDDKLLADLIEKLPGQPAQLTDLEIDGISRCYTADLRTLRVSLLFMTKSGQELVDRVEKDAEYASLLAAVTASADEFAARLRSLAEMVDSSSKRIQVAMCWREDGVEMLKGRDDIFDRLNAGAAAGGAA